MQLELTGENYFGIEYLTIFSNPLRKNDKWVANVERRGLSLPWSMSATVLSRFIYALVVTVSGNGQKLTMDHMILRLEEFEL
jgi:hypothetical protein